MKSLLPRGFCSRKKYVPNSNERNAFSLKEKPTDGNILLCDRRDVPTIFHYPFIETGYRKPNSSTWQCLKSLFYIHNESFNIWSHVFVTVYFVVRYTVALLEMSSLGSSSQRFYHPMLSSAIGTCFMYFSSAIAHLFNSRSEMFHNTCFFFDYAGIGTYTFTSGQVMYYYTRPIDSGWAIFESPVLFTAVGSVFSLLMTYTFCKSKLSQGKHDSLKRIIPAFVCWFNSTISVAFGVTLCSCDAILTRCKSFTACNPLIKTYHQRHFFSLIVAGMLFGTHLPERLLPGAFDYLGNSHHFLHIFAGLSTEYAFKTLEEAIESRNAPSKEILAKSLDDTCFVDTVLPSILVLFGNLAIVYWFMKTPKNRALGIDKNK